MSGVIPARMFDGTLWVQAGEIERLRRELAEARAALAWIARVNATDYEYQRVAKAALKADQPTEAYFCPNCANAGCTDCTPDKSSVGG